MDALPVAGEISCDFAEVCVAQDDSPTDVDWNTLSEFIIPSEVLEQGENQSARTHEAETAIQELKDSFFTVGHLKTKCGQIAGWIPTFEFLRNLHDGGSENCSQLRLLLLGDGTAGRKPTRLYSDYFLDT